MNEGQIKTKIFLIQIVDFFFLFAVFFLGVYSVLYSENGKLMGLATLIGLFLVNKLGNLGAVKIVYLRQGLKRLQPKHI